MDVPEFLGLPSLGKFDASVPEVAPLKGLARELPDAFAVVCDSCAKGVLCICADSVQPGVESDFSPAHRCVHPHVKDACAYRRADKVNVPAQAAARHRALDLFGRGGVTV